MSLNHGCMYRHRAGRDAAGLSLVAYLARTFAHSDAFTWRGRIARGEIDVDGHPADASAIVRPGQTVVWRRPPWDEPEVPVDWRIVFEDEWLLAVEKPSGLPTLPGGGFLEHTLLAMVRRERAGASPLHRLGRFTSGLVLCARDRESAATLSRAWRDHLVEKRYRALASGVMEWERRAIDAPIGPVAHPRLGTVHAATSAGRVAQSAVRVVERRAEATLVDVDIRTGRPHQVRIHLAWAGHPLVGDRLYAPGGLPRADDPALPGEGGYLLHACRLAFVHPGTGVPLVLESAPPPSLLPVGIRR